MTDYPNDKQHWAAQRERGSFWLMKLTAISLRVLGRRVMAPVLYGTVLYFFIFGRRPAQCPPIPGLPRQLERA